MSLAHRRRMSFPTTDTPNCCKTGVSAEVVSKPTSVGPVALKELSLSDMISSPSSNNQRSPNLGSETVLLTVSSAERFGFLRQGGRRHSRIAPTIGPHTHISPLPG